MKTTLAVRWTAVDDESHIKDQYLTIMTSDTEHLHTPTFKVIGICCLYSCVKKRDVHTVVTKCNPAQKNEEK